MATAADNPSDTTNGPVLPANEATLDGALPSESVAGEDDSPAVPRVKRRGALHDVISSGGVAASAVSIEVKQELNNIDGDVDMQALDRPPPGFEDDARRTKSLVEKALGQHLDPETSKTMTKLSRDLHQKMRSLQLNKAQREKIVNEKLAPEAGRIPSSCRSCQMPFECPQLDSVKVGEDISIVSVKIDKDMSIRKAKIMIHIFSLYQQKCLDLTLIEARRDDLRLATKLSVFQDKCVAALHSSRDKLNSLDLDVGRDAFKFIGMSDELVKQKAEVIFLKTVETVSLEMAARDERDRLSGKSRQAVLDEVVSRDPKSMFEKAVEQQVQRSLKALGVKGKGKGKSLSKDSSGKGKGKSSSSSNQPGFQVDEASLFVTSLKSQNPLTSDEVDPFVGQAQGKGFSPAKGGGIIQSKGRGRGGKATQQRSSSMKGLGKSSKSENQNSKGKGKGKGKSQKARGRGRGSSARGRGKGRGKSRLSI